MHLYNVLIHHTPVPHVSSVAHPCIAISHWKPNLVVPTGSLTPETSKLNRGKDACFWVGAGLHFFPAKVNTITIQSHQCVFYLMVGLITRHALYIAILHYYALTQLHATLCYFKSLLVKWQCMIIPDTVGNLLIYIWVLYCRFYCILFCLVRCTGKLLLSKVSRIRYIWQISDQVQ